MGHLAIALCRVYEGFNNRDDVEHVMDSNQNVIAFSNGGLYEITTNDASRTTTTSQIAKQNKFIDLYSVSLMTTSKHYTS